MFKRKNQQMFLLTMNTSSFVGEIPEVTLWKSFDEALSAAMDAIGGVAEELEWDNDFQVFVPDGFEIFPISVSSSDTITWLGKPWTKHNINIGEN